MGGPKMNSRQIPSIPRLFAALTVVALVLMSGCAGKAKTTANIYNGPEATVSDSTGAIRGTVIDSDTLPIGGAGVGIQPADQAPTQTDDSGLFAFSELAPGTYTIQVVALGFEAVNHQAVVTAGEVTDVEIKMSPRALEGVPYARTFPAFQGKFFCGFGTAAISGPCKIAGFTFDNPVDQTWNQLSGGEENIFEFYDMIEGNKSNPESDQLKTLVVEITWMPTSAGSKWLQASIEDTAKNTDGTPGGRNNSEPLYATASGVGPLKMAVSPGVKHERGEIAMPIDWPGFTIGVFPTVDPASPAVNSPTNGRPILLGASAYTEQSFQVWITLFYNEPAPEDYTALV